MKAGAIDQSIERSMLTPIDPLSTGHGSGLPPEFERQEVELRGALPIATGRRGRARTLSSSVTGGGAGGGGLGGYFV